MFLTPIYRCCEGVHLSNNYHFHLQFLNEKLYMRIEAKVDLGIKLWLI